MVRLATIPAALLVSAALLLLAVCAAQWFLPLVSHGIPLWLDLLVSLGSAAFGFAVAIEKQRTTPAQQDEPLTPLVRRSPLTGLREL